MNVNIKWNQGMELTGEAKLVTPLSWTQPKPEGKQRLPTNRVDRPGAAGCSSMDVLSILRKKKVNISAYECKVNVESYQEDHPHAHQDAS